jgi:hypothetical protein
VIKASSASAEREIQYRGRVIFNMRFISSGFPAASAGLDLSVLSIIKDIAG